MQIFRDEQQPERKYMSNSRKQIRGWTQAQLVKASQMVHASQTMNKNAHMTADLREPESLYSLCPSPIAMDLPKSAASFDSLRR